MPDPSRSLSHRPGWPAGIPPSPFTNGLIPSIITASGAENPCGGACHLPSIAHAMDRPGLSRLDAANFMSDPIAAEKARISAPAGTFCSCVP